MKFENQVCPVCNNVFKDDDDVVVCPDCGTPHHRDCYKALGECKNKSLHG
jgi:predicted amidophosphoribosyltransferase